MYKQWAEKATERALNKLRLTSDKIGARFPQIENDGIYNDEPPHGWTNGFWPGTLWLASILTKEEKFKTIACEIEQKMDTALDGFQELNHDVGFMWLLSSGANYAITKNEKSKLRLLKAANILVGRFNLKGGFIRAWNADRYGWAIIDGTMNLPLLYRAAYETGDPRFSHIAESYADTVVRDFIRPNGSSGHIASFNPESGEFIEFLRGQGYAADSAWARGNSWAIYGLALAYRHLKKEIYLDTAKKVADFIIAHLPEDKVPYWDYLAPITENTPRDTSAAACTACGFLELSKHLYGEEGEKYRREAYLILKALSDNYFIADESNQAMLGGGTVDFVSGIGIDKGLIYGDYFYLEGLSRLADNDAILWYDNIKDYC